MKISTKSCYGLRAMKYLANSYNKNDPCSLKKISEKEDISFDYLEKIMSELKKAELVSAKKGIQGGYFLARPPEKITAGEVINLLEGGIAPIRCMSKSSNKKSRGCDEGCETASICEKMRDSFSAILYSITLKDLIKEKTKI